MIKIKFFLTILICVVCIVNNTIAQDWANLSRYQKENSDLQELKTSENRIVFFGNSITESWVKIRPEYFADKPYINRGISGQTTPQMILRFRQDVINLHPKSVVILAGINDIAGNTGVSTIDMIMNNIISMVELAEANKIRVLLCSVLPALDFPWRKGMEPSLKVIELNKQIKAFAATRNLTYVDYFSSMVNDQNGLQDELGLDGVHPNYKGYSVMESILDKVL